MDFIYTLIKDGERREVSREELKKNHFGETDDGEQLLSAFEDWADKSTPFTILTATDTLLEIARKETP